MQPAVAGNQSLIFISFFVYARGETEDIHRERTSNNTDTRATAHMTGVCAKQG